MSDQLHALRIFARIAQTGSFSRAAKELDLSQPTASRIVSVLEKELGTALLTRTTRAVTLTEAGVDYLARIQPVLDALDEANQVVRGAGNLRGVLRVGASSSLSSRAIIPRLGVFRDLHPNLRVELLVDDKRQDLILEGVDVAIRTGRLADASAIARLIGRWPMYLIASPSYVERCGMPATPEEIHDHLAIVGGPLGATWTFSRDGQESKIKLQGNLSISASEVAVNAAVEGLGLAVGSIISFQHHLDAGRLVRLLPDWSLGEVEIHALFPGSQSAKPSAKAFIDFLMREMRSLFPHS